jgi:hypothetical protein
MEPAAAPPKPPHRKPISTADLRLVEGPGGRPEVVEAQLPYYVEGRKLKIVTVRVSWSLTVLPDLPERRLSRTGVLITPDE